jgi:hypothetical protein
VGICPSEIGRKLKDGKPETISRKSRFQKFVNVVISSGKIFSLAKILAFRRNQKVLRTSRRRLHFSVQ